MTHDEMASYVREALTLVMDSDAGLPRLATLLVALDQPGAAASCINLQSQLLPVLRPSRRRRRK